MMEDLEARLAALAREYPTELVEGQLRDIPRIAYHVRLAVGALADVPVGQRGICDIGGGIGLFSLGCAAAGYGRVVLVDDFADPVNRKVGDAVLGIHRRHGVRVEQRDVAVAGIGGLCDGFDTATAFDTMEHWHSSPKRLFHEVVRALRPGAAFAIGGPNCVNLRKRITVPFGIGKWSAMADWYETERFRGHVREPDVDDLHYIAQDLGLAAVSITGRNWHGHDSPRAAVRIATRIVDPLLRLRPGLCSDIYLVGRTAARA